MDEKDRLEAELSALEHRARSRRQRSMLVTLVPVLLTALIVVYFAIDIAQKNVELYDTRKAREELDQKLSEGQVKLDEVEKSRKKLEEETRRLEDRKKDLEAYLRNQRAELYPLATAGAAAGAPRTTDAPESVVLAEEGKVPEGLRPTPRVKVVQRLGARGSVVLDVLLSIDVPEAQKEMIKRVVYDLNPVFYIAKSELVGGDAPSFEAAVTVNACKSTVVVKIELRDGSRMELDLDWCRAEGWPQKRAEKQVVEKQSPQEVERLLGAGSQHPVPQIAAPPATGRPNDRFVEDPYR
ncbi:hypothetical protein [Polyangium mundeleinium]|uniref:Uncharacterized protein n=1 Tax=Polyangium mundeleinium TaxID=2995306 RepID=A0ABT5F1W2_9BACT|nr:hypothetical protein [Polyangium mundeleinium]MDC0748088.1 hypothetical protein [Polyangium mundeleinium]